MRQIVLLRGINLGSRNRVAMPKLRDLLASAGFEDVQTYLQSGNVVLSSSLSSAKLAAECKRLISDRLGLDLELLVRTKRELAAIVRRDPLGSVAADPKRYQVIFLSARPPRKVVDELAALAAGGERLVAEGRELYAWHPDGIGRSTLAARMAGKQLGVVATARNWATVTALLALAEAQG
jgi:uncharacterized protein (DUF1697 family)